MFNFIVGLSMIIIVFIMNETVVKRVRILRRKGDNIKNMHLSGMCFMASLYATVLVVLFFVM